MDKVPAYSSCEFKIFNNMTVEKYSIEESFSTESLVYTYVFASSASTPSGYEKDIAEKEDILKRVFIDRIPNKGKSQVHYKLFKIVNKESKEVTKFTFNITKVVEGKIEPVKSSCLECLSQYLYFDHKHGECYQTTTAIPEFKNNKDLYTDIRMCAPTITCSDFLVKNYENTEYVAKLPKYSSCVIKITNMIPKDGLSLNPTFSVSTANPKGVEYSYDTKGTKIFKDASKLNVTYKLSIYA
jgi:hypothetical protein